MYIDCLFIYICVCIFPYTIDSRATDVPVGPEHGAVFGQESRRGRGHQGKGKRAQRRRRPHRHPNRRVEILYDKKKKDREK
jgi:hypothetical protein